MEKSVFLDSMGAEFICNDGQLLDCYDKIYPEVNEDLVDIYLDLDFEDKDVLSVVSSSDQIYTPKILGARHVDGFDRNRLTKYYYYMRRWAIKYNKQIYPYGLIDGNRKYLYDLLTKVKASSKSETNALNFWIDLYNKDVKIENLFYEDTVNVGQTLFSDNIRYIKDVSSDDLRFYNLNMFEKFDTDKTYDYVMMSNIIEYAHGDINTLKTVRNNLYNLLNKDGKVICSRLMNKRCGFNEEELSTFGELFDIYDYGCEEGYTYTKKC